ncbi:MAG: histidinol-phosphate transaminase [Omnitrophica WOR_2 bacterium RIFCSPHIGHO2_02_FULL_45_21]|nr:MAG: histidinol-phosphate transaminase [Omnitrophica WOR_2 bacterium RIFCSPHIGHO2_02_FULL_45_21]
MINRKILEITPYQPGKPIEEVKRQLGLKEVIKLASNENPLGPSPKAVLAIKKSLTKINRYPEGSCFYLRQRLSKKLKVRPENLIFGNGSDELIDIVIKAFCEPDDEIITADTTFLEYRIIALQNGRAVRCIPLKDFRYDLARIKDRIGPKTKAIFIANPNNPTGTYVTKREVDDFLNGLPENVVAIFDQAYLEFVENKDFPLSLNYFRQGKNVIILRTFSKIYGLAGLRIGYGIAREEFIQYMERARQPFNVNTLAQEAALAALDDTVFIRKAQRAVREGKKYLYGELDRLKINYIPSAANFILIDLKRDGLKIFNKLLKEGVIVRDMQQYGLNNFIRVTIGREKENKKFVAALKKVLS